RFCRGRRPDRRPGSAAFSVVALLRRDRAARHAAALRVAAGGPLARPAGGIFRTNLVAHVLGELAHLALVLLRLGVPLAQDLARGFAAAQAEGEAQPQRD